MAIKYYAYYLKGNKLAIAQRDTDDTSSNEYGRYKSPTESVTDGLEVEYTYIPEYNLYNDENVGNAGGLFHTNATFVLDGYLCFARSIPSGTANWTGTSSATAGTEGDTGGQSLDYIVVRGSSRWNGLHRIQTAGAAYNTLLGGIIKTYTRARTIGPYVTAADLDLGDTETVFDGGTQDIYLADRGFEVGDYVWMSGNTAALNNNGVFTISAVTPNSSVGSSTLTFDTRYFMPSSNSTTFSTEESSAASFTTDTDGGSNLVTVAKIEHEVCKIYTDVNVLNDEADDIDLTSYQSKAIVYYLKAKMAEDGRDMEGREYFMRLFKKQLEKERSARKRGPYVAMGNANMRNY